jgi:hypothetical protein
MKCSTLFLAWWMVTAALTYPVIRSDMMSLRGAGRWDNGDRCFCIAFSLMWPITLPMVATPKLIGEWSKTPASW